MAQNIGEGLAINIGVNVTGLPQVQQVQTRMTSLNKTIQKSTSQYNVNAVATNKWAKGALQQAGYQVGDFAVQVANGTSKMQAFGQQGSQLAGIFGPVGAIIGAGIAIVSAFAVAAEKASGNVMSLAKATANLRSNINDLKKEVDIFTFGAKSEEELAFLKEIDKKQRELNGLYSERDKLITRQVNILMGMKKFQNDAVAAEKKAIEIVDAQLSRKSQSIDIVREELQLLRDRMSFYIKEREAADDILGSEEGLTAALKANLELYEKTAAWEKIYGGKTAKAAKKVKEAVDPISKMFESLDEQINRVATTMEDSMSNAFISMVDGTKSVKDAFRAMAADVVKELYRVLVVQQLVGGYDAKTGAGSGIVGAAMGLFAGKRAMGGPVTGGKAYLVGERGPEAFIPSRSGYIAPNVSSSATPSVTINQTFTGGVTQGDLARMLPQITEMTKRAIIDQVQRGGATARVFR